jgi:hypothetical protein
VLDLSKNRINLLFNDFTTNNLVSLFSGMVNISDINLSYNHLRRFITYFNVETRQINTIDLSHNLIDKFYMLSSSIVQDPIFPTNLKPLDSNNNNEDDIDIDDNDDDGAVSDGERYLNINLLDISSNMFQELNFKKQFKTIKNLKRLDSSFNSRLVKIKYLSYNIIHVKNLINNFKKQNGIEWNQFINDNNNKLFCVNELNLDNCNINSLPSLEYACVKKLTMAKNSLNSNLIVRLSKFSLNFLKYLNLMDNNVTDFDFEIKENDALLLDKYSLDRNTTFIDLKQNRNLNCDCDLIQAIDDSNENIRLLTDCNFNSSCPSLDTNGSNTSSGMNKRIVFLVAIICAIIGILAVLIIYSLFSDIRNLNLNTLGSVLLCCKIKFARSADANDNNDGGSSSGRARSRVPYVRLSRPSDEDNNLEIGGF